MTKSRAAYLPKLHRHAAFIKRNNATACSVEALIVEIAAHSLTDSDIDEWLGEAR